MNTFRTTILLAVLTALLVWLGDMFGGRQGAIMALILAGGMNFLSYWFSDKIVIKMYGGQETTAQDDPELYGLVQDLAQRAGLPMPKVYVLPQDTPNAFATGRNPEHAAVAVTDGIRKILNKRELAGVLGHELTHVKNRDILVSTIAATLAGAIGYLAQMAQWAMIFGGNRDRDDEGGGGNIFGLDRHDDRRADCSYADSNGCVSFERIWRRRRRRKDYRGPVGAGQRAKETAHGRAKHSA